MLLAGWAADQRRAIWTGAAAWDRIGCQGCSRRKTSGQAVLGAVVSLRRPSQKLAISGSLTFIEEGDNSDEPTHTTPHGLGACSDAGRFHARECGSRGAAHHGRTLHTGADALRARGDAGPRHAVHVPLRATRRPREANAGQKYGTQPGRVVERIAGWAGL